MNDADRLVNESVAVERTDVSPGLIGVIATALIGVVAVSIIVIMLIYPGALRGMTDAPRITAAAPRLEVDPAADLAASREAEDHELDSYGWVDKPRGIVRVPVDQAMHEVAAEGIKDWPEGAK